MDWTANNPFATHYTQTGRRFIPPEDTADVATLTQCFLRNGRVGQIVGPHGCGKTSLAYAMARSMFGSFGNIQFAVIRRQSWRGRTVEILSNLQGNGSADLRVVDGIETLSHLHRWCLVKSCLRRNGALLLTTHRKLLSLPLITTLNPSLGQFEKIVTALNKPPTTRVPAEKIQEAFDRHDGDYREGLMYLYDFYQHQRVSSPLC
ncbi:MAG: AAA family ATPase [Mariniblastus sp.]|nr:AAA family ATPase [Mariniblastus sp.]